MRCRAFFLAPLRALGKGISVHFFLALRRRPAALSLANRFLPNFLRPIEAASAPGLRMPLRLNLRFNDANRLPEPSLALRLAAIA